MQTTILDSLLNTIKNTPEKIQFSNVINTIDSNYHFTETEFTNGDLLNKAGENNGSCKILSFAKIHNLTAEQTLHLFGDYYRNDVLQNPNNNDHQNIRNFIKNGWESVNFKNNVLTLIT